MKLNKKSTKDNPLFAKVQEALRQVENPPEEKPDLSVEGKREKETKKRKKKNNPFKKVAENAKS